MHACSEFWSRLPCHPAGDLPDPGIKAEPPASSALQVDSLPTEPPGHPKLHNHWLDDDYRYSEYILPWKKLLFGLELVEKLSSQLDLIMKEERHSWEQLDRIPNGEEASLFMVRKMSPLSC